jgi:hypothetical protein
MLWISIGLPLLLIVCPLEWLGWRISRPATGTKVGWWLGALAWLTYLGFLVLVLPWGMYGIYTRWIVSLAMLACFPRGVNS